MPLDTSTLPDEEDLAGLDPDNPVDDQSFIGKLTITARVDLATGTVVPSYGAEDNARMLETCRKFLGESKYGKYEYAAWYIEAEGISVVRDDGKPWRQHEILKLQSKEGKALGKNQAHGQLAAAYQEFGVSVSYAKAGQPDSAYGRIFEFGSETVGKKPYAKTLRMWPKQMFPEDYVYDGEVRTVHPKSESDAEGASVPAAVDAISESDAIAVLQEILHGTKPEDMLDLILGDNRLKGVPTVFGVPLVESATDESLAQVLTENKAMVLTGGGVLQRV